MKYILKISYDGENYSGFQVQDNKLTIQGTIENALKQVLKQDISLVASGRTDGGVSAIEQVCHIEVGNALETGRTKGYINAILPSDIRVLSIDPAPDDFHARFSSKKKTYEYYFYVGKDIIPVYEKFATRVGYDVDVNKMKDACKSFLGEHDFTAFSKSNTDVKTKVRTIFDIDILPVNTGLYKLTITGNGFLYNMVRIIMGTLVSVGMGKISINELKDVIDGGARECAGKTMPAKGLVLKKVEY